MHNQRACYAFAFYNKRVENQSRRDKPRNAENHHRKRQRLTQNRNVIHREQQTRIAVREDFHVPAIQRFKDEASEEKLFKRCVYQHYINKYQEKITLRDSVVSECADDHFALDKLPYEQKNNPYNCEHAEPEQERDFNVFPVAFKYEKILEF